MTTTLYFVSLIFRAEDIPNEAVRIKLVTVKSTLPKSKAEALGDAIEKAYETIPRLKEDNHLLALYRVDDIKLDGEIHIDECK